MLKPAGSACNLDCHYCYYLDKAVQYGGRGGDGDELLEVYIRQYIEANEVPTVTLLLAWREPLLLGLGFYRKAMDPQKNADGKRIESTRSRPTVRWSTREWCDLFAENNFLVGISLDGPQDIHDLPGDQGRAADLRTCDAYDRDVPANAAWSTTR